MTGAAVLDIACGEGYGAANLASVARHVTGVDIDAGTVAEARARYGNRDNLTFLHGDAEKIPADDASFDVVVSFETIEHLKDADRFLREIKRVLKPGGLLIISSPNEPEYRKSLSHPNPHHLREFDLPSFQGILSANFRTCDMRGQRMFIGSMVAPLANGSIPNEPSYRAFTGDLGGLTRPTEIHSGVGRLASPEYYVCFCSDNEIYHPVAADSVLVLPDDDLWLSHREITKWASGVHDETEILRRRIGEVEHELALARQRESALAEQARLAEATHQILSDNRSTVHQLLETGQQLAAHTARADRALSQREEQIGELLAQAEQRGSDRQRQAFERDLSMLSPLLSRLNGEQTPATVHALVDGLALAWHEREIANREAALVRGRLTDEQSLRDRLETSVASLAALERRMQEREAEHAADRQARDARDAERKAAHAAELQARDARDAEREAAHAAELQARDARDAELRETVQGLGQQLTIAKNEQGRLETEARDRIARSDAALAEAARDAENRLRARDEAHRTATAALQERIERQSQTVLRLTAEVAAREAALAQAAGEAESRLQARDEAHRTAVAALTTEIAVHEADRVHANRQATEAAASRDEAHAAQIASLTATLADLRRQLEAAERKLAQTGSAPTDTVLAYRDALDRSSRRASHVVRLDMMRNPPSSSVNLQAFNPGEPLYEKLFFDEQRYVRLYGDALEDGVDPFRHYIETGWREGRSPNVMFDGDWYLATHAEALASGLNPLSHYVRVGAAAELQPHPLFDRHYYVSRHPESVRHAGDAFQHFVRAGLWANHAPNAEIETLAGEGPVIAVIEQCLGEELSPAIDAETWPSTLNDYWIPQSLRDYVGDEFGQDPIDGLSYLFSVIEAYDADPDGFAASPALKYLVQRARRLTAPSDQTQPDVSIVIPVYNNLVYTLTAIVSILEHETSYSYEIVVGDDRSTDATPSIVSRLGHNIVLARHATNLGFLHNCNECARQAKGRYLVFLNNDTIVLPGWLDELIAPFAADPAVGMTGSKLINGDGTLQEAGGILWNDGSAWNYGRGSNARLPHFSYSKDVDYISGASIAFPKTLWDELGGFDPLYTPAYNEDSDIAFRVRAAGYRTWLAAHSVLIHHEGRSHGRDVTSGIKAYQVANQRKFLERWSATLAAEHFPNAERVFLARDRSARRPHILIVDHYVPQWDRDAGSRTMLHFIRMFLKQGFHVTFWPDNLYNDRTYARPLQNLGVEVIYGPQYVGGFEAWYRDNADDLGYVFLSRPQIAEKYIDAIDRQKSKVLFYGHDLHWRRLEIQWNVSQDEAVHDEMTAMRTLEEKICLGSDAIFYPSQTEIDILRASLPDLPPAAAVPAWFFDEAEIAAMWERNTQAPSRDAAHLMFVGGFQHGPNVDGVLWFVSEVWPTIKAAVADARLTIAGSNPPGDIRNLVNTAPSVTVAGHISDAALRQLYAQASAAIVPLRFGGGVKGKVIEAFSNAIPVVSTSIGMQGIDADDICIVADEPGAFADGVIRCLLDPAATQARAARAIEFLSRDYALAALVRSMQPYVPELGGPPATSGES
ncbi:methyltransferase domain-containing protein [Methylobacterium sp. SyP6R]|uniref:methyltransferase domain-containing protein n=1 Tax=Methylobacterium sp. SyP6R TaxID=2718876 RepID=UPI001F012929|nr:methyltransferase domain-containing protein [Methylobacterium sp. SyP6R]MCF4124261.1 methyltransferase domain-containing protein [Methylobacterium sp. SyP6R]